MKSILQNGRARCYLCGLPPMVGDTLECHHVFGGALRKRSEEYGLKVYLHGKQCHRDGPFAVHRCAETRRALQAEAQRLAMEAYGWTPEDWRKRFYKNYRGDEDV